VTTTATSRDESSSLATAFSLRPQPRRRPGVERPLGVAVEVVPVADAEDIAVALVEADPVGRLRVWPVAALEPAVDDVGDHAVPGRAAGRPVRGRGRPLARDHGVARRLVVPRRHPEPQRRLERHHRVRCHQVRVVQQVHADGAPRRPVVVVAGFGTKDLSGLRFARNSRTILVEIDYYYLQGELDGAAAEVLLARRARPLWPRLAVVGRRLALLLEAVAPGKGPVGRARPPAGCLVGGLAQERGHLPLPQLGAARRAEVRVRACRGEERVVSVEPASGARRVVAVEEEPLEEVPRHDGPHARADGTGTGAAAALALAAGAAVLIGTAAPPEATAAEAVRTRSASGLQPALLGAREERRGGQGAKDSRRCCGHARGSRCRHALMPDCRCANCPLFIRTKSWIGGAKSSHLRRHSTPELTSGLWNTEAWRVRPTCYITRRCEHIFGNIVMLKTFGICGNEEPGTETRPKASHWLVNLTPLTPPRRCAARRCRSSHSSSAAPVLRLRSMWSPTCDSCAPVGRGVTRAPPVLGQQPAGHDGHGRRGGSRRA
jgi:hypothetical protein